MKIPPTATFGCPLNFSFCKSQKYPKQTKAHAQKKKRTMQKTPVNTKRR